MQQHVRPLCAVALGLGVLATTSCGKDDGPQQPTAAPAVVVVPVTTATLRNSIEFIGRCEAVEDVHLRARVSGYLEGFFFEEGSLVEQGAELFQIDPRPYQVAVDKAKAQLLTARGSEKESAG